MREIAAYLLCVLAGNDAPTVEQVTAVISSVGEVDEAKLTALVAELGRSLAYIYLKK